MISVIIIHYGEIALKGNNRWLFEEKLVENIKKALGSLPYKSVRRISGRILIYLENDLNQEDFKKSLGFVFGITGFSFAWEVKADLEIINKTLEELLRLSLRATRGSEAIPRINEKVRDCFVGAVAPSRNDKIKEAITFRISTIRSDKKFPLTSEDVNRQVGEYVLENVKCQMSNVKKEECRLKVDLHNPDINCFIEIVEGKALLYFEKIPAPGGMPAGVNGKVVSMISSGFDSPVASWQLMKRGAEVIFVHFHSFPRTSRASIDNVKNIIRILNKYQFGSTLYLVPFFEIQKEILTKAPQDHRIILYRRMMFRIAEQLARENKAKALVTGESLGQVASQTLENIEVISSVVKIPIFRPLIGTDKIDIMNMAQKIGTYDISKLPYEDCCSLFVPKHPKTKARIDEVEFIEKDFDIEKLTRSVMLKIEKEIF